jgi:hypothetical protein
VSLSDEKIPMSTARLLTKDQVPGDVRQRKKSASIQKPLVFPRAHRGGQRPLILRGPTDSSNRGKALHSLSSDGGKRMRQNNYYCGLDIKCLPKGPWVKGLVCSP